MSVDPAKVRSMLDASFTVDIDPPSKARARFTKQGSKTMTYTPAATKHGEDAVARAFRLAVPGWKVQAAKFYAVEATFFCGTRQRRDVDNMAKLLLDGLNGVAYLDDNAVLDLHVRKTYVPRAEARIEARIWELADDDVNTLVCQGCGNRFRTYESWSDEGRTYCSRACGMAHRQGKRMTTCQHCGDTYEAERENRGRDFCSKTCSDAHKRAEVTCTGCGGTFTRPQSQVGQTNYCTEECRRRHAARTAAKRKSPMRGKCEVCGAGTTRKEYTRCGAHQKRPGPPAGRKRGPYKKTA